MRSIKVVLVGDTKVGKSCILRRFVQNTFDRNMPITIGVAFLTKVVDTASGPVRLQLWDTAGQEKFHSLAPMYYRSSHVAVLVYDVTSESTLDGLEDWKAEIVDKAPPNVKLIVVGNKVDLGEGRLIRSTAGQKLAKRFNAVSYIETSAQTGVGIQELFFGIAELDLTRDSADGETARPSGEGGGCCG